MNKKAIGIFIVMLLIITVLPVGVSTEKSSYTKENFESIIFSEPIIQEEEQYVSVSVEEATSCLMKPGEPILPVVTKVYTFPFGTKIKEIVCKPSGIQEKTVFKEIIPCPEPVTCSSVKTAIAKTVKNHEVYSSANLYPDSWHSYRTGSGLDGNEHVVFLTIGVYPVRYSPERSVLQYIDRVEITVVYEEPLQPLLMNDGYDMVIIAPSEFADELQPLVDYKNPIMVTKLCTLDNVYSGTYFGIVIGRDDQEIIKNFIRQAIEQWGITFVLLVGGSDEFPVRMSYAECSGDEVCCISDLYYADVFDSNGGFCSWDSNDNGKYGETPPKDEVDLYPDVHLGRLACTKESEVITVVDKIINYDGSCYEYWFNHLVVCGGDSHDDDGGVDEGEYATQAIVDIMQGFPYAKIWASNGLLEDYRNINTAIEQGAGFVSFYGHGSSYSWSTHPHGDMDTWLPPGGYTTPRIGYLTNTDMLPIVTVSACHPNDFNANKNCWGWKFISNSKGGGIAQIGPTGLHYSYRGTDATKGLGGFMHLNFYRAYAEDNAETFGEMWVKGINRYLNFRPWGMGIHDYKDIEQYQPFGDPSLIIQSPSLHRPEKPTISGPGNGEFNTSYDYEALSSDADNNKIYYWFDWGDGNQSGWIGPFDSNAEGMANHTWTKEGSYEIKALAKDEHGAVSEWSDPYVVSMPKSYDIKFINAINNLLTRLFNKININIPCHIIDIFGG